MVTQIFNPQLIEAAGSNRGKVKGASSPEIIGAVNRSRKEKGDSTLARGAKSDLIYEDRRVESDDVAALTISQCKGYLRTGVVSRQELAINYVERDLPIRTHIPNSEPDSSDPGSLRKDDWSALVEKISNIREEQKRDLYRVLEKYISNMTTKLGRCNLFSYKFQVELDKPIIEHSNPNPIRHTTSRQGANKLNAS
jgi:hypothetical protein